VVVDLEGDTQLEGGFSELEEGCGATFEAQGLFV